MAPAYRKSRCNSLEERDQLAPERSLRVAKSSNVPTRSRDATYEPFANRIDHRNEDDWNRMRFVLKRGRGGTTNTDYNIRSPCD